MITTRVSRLAKEFVSSNQVKLAAKPATFLDVLDRGIPEQLRGNDNYQDAINFIRVGSNGVINHTNDMEYVATQASKFLLKTSDIAQNVVNVIIRNIIKAMSEELVSYNTVTPAKCIRLLDLPPIFSEKGIGLITSAHALSTKVDVKISHLVENLSQENFLYLIKTGIPSLDALIEDTVSLYGYSSIIGKLEYIDLNRQRILPYESLTDMSMPMATLVLLGLLDNRHPTMKDMDPADKAKYSAMFSYVASMANAQKTVAVRFSTRSFVDASENIYCVKSHFASLVRANPGLTIYNGPYVDLFSITSESIEAANKVVENKEKGAHLEKLQRLSSYMRSRIMRVTTKEIMDMKFSEEENIRILNEIEAAYTRVPYSIGTDLNDYLRMAIANAIDPTGSCYEMLNIIDTYLDLVDSKNVEEAVIWAHCHLVSRFCAEQLKIEK